jgi:hypothetical protein
MVPVQYVWRGQIDLDSMIRMAEELTSAILVVLVMALSYYRKYMAGVL